MIIGAGPSGLFAAAELAPHGVGARLVERRVRPHQEARATAIQPGTLEILDSVGLLAPVLAASEHVRGSRLFGPAGSELSAMSFDGVDCRCPFQCSLPQYETERLLENHVVSLGGAVERGVTATRVEAGPDGARVELAHADGRVETAHAAFVVGAGGAHSVTRESMHEPRLDGGARPASVAWFAPFRMHRRIVSRLSDGRRFLIGDAAHLSSPSGGEGLNAGLHDGYDLAWKLALVARGRAHPSLLDVSDQVHRAIVDVADAVRARGSPGDGRATWTSLETRRSTRPERAFPGAAESWSAPRSHRLPVRGVRRGALAALDRQLASYLIGE